MEQPQARYSECEVALAEVETPLEVVQEGGVGEDEVPQQSRSLRYRAAAGSVVALLVIIVVLGVLGGSKSMKAMLSADTTSMIGESSIEDVCPSEWEVSLEQGVYVRSFSVKRDHKYGDHCVTSDGTTKSAKGCYKIKIFTTHWYKEGSLCHCKVPLDLVIPSQRVPLGRRPATPVQSTRATTTTASTKSP